MVIGEVIDPHYDENSFYIAPVGSVTNDTLELIKCWKCPDCGHSDYIESAEVDYFNMEFNLRQDKTI